MGIIKLKTILEIVLVVGVVCSCNQGKPTNKLYAYNSTSAEWFVRIGAKIKKGDTIGEEEWDGLFQSKGYQTYLSYSDSSYKKEQVMRCMDLVFNPKNKSQLDSLLQLPIPLNSNMMEFLVFNNFNAINENMDLAKSFLRDTDFQSIFKGADSIAQTFIPANNGGRDKLFEVSILCADPDGKVIGNAIVLDLNTIMHLEYQEIMQLIAHEYHHNYRNLKTPSIKDPVFQQINKLHQEGLADLIDKPLPPITANGLYPEAVIDLYNATFFSTGEKLKALDSLSVASKQLDFKQSEEQFNGFLKFGGHPNGLYMALLIQQVYGLDTLVQTYNDPIGFIELYQSSAIQNKKQYVFSDAFMNQMEELKSKTPSN